MITLDPAKGRPVTETDEERIITYADPNGRLYDLPIVSFLILKAAIYAEEIGADFRSWEQVSELTPEVGHILIEEGWFTYEELIAAAARDEAAGLDDDLKEMFG